MNEANRTPISTNKFRLSLGRVTIIAIMPRIVIETGYAPTCFIDSAISDIRMIMCSHLNIFQPLGSK